MVRVKTHGIWFTSSSPIVTSCSPMLPRGICAALIRDRPDIGDRGLNVKLSITMNLAGPLINPLLVLASAILDIELRSERMALKREVRVVNVGLIASLILVSWLVQARPEPTLS